jgi:hypothetical protein
VSKIKTQTLDLIERKADQKSDNNDMRPQIIRGILITTFMMVNNKIRKAKEEGFR